MTTPSAPGSAPDDLLRDPLLRDAPTIEGFKVLEPAVLYAKLGQGGMGAVYRGRHCKLDLDVAVKCLKPSLAAEDPDFVRRFEREARLAASIAHQNVVRVMDVHVKNGLHYLVMEFVRGETAAERVKRKGRLSEREALAILLGATAGLAEAHANGIVHRDIKPENILISLEGRVKLADLGLAKSTGAVDGRSVSMSASRIMGTPQYMPPEQWDTTEVTAAADIWALGASFYFLCAGQPGISATGTYHKIARRIQEQEFPNLRAERPDLRPELHTIFERCVRLDPNDRFADARALLRELRKLQVDDEDVLLDPAAGTGISRLGVVTPPPRQTLLRIRAKLETTPEGSSHDTASAAATAPLPARGTAAASAARASVPRRQHRVTSRSANATGIVVGALCVAGAIVFAFRGTPGESSGRSTPTDGNPRPPVDTPAEDPLAKAREDLRTICGEGRFVVAETTSRSLDYSVRLDRPPQGVSEVRLRLQKGDARQGAFEDADATTLPAVDGASRTLRGAEDGLHLLRIAVVGREGDGKDPVVVELTSRSVSFDSTPPQVTVLAPSPNTPVAEVVTVRVTAEDGPNTVKGVTARIADRAQRVQLRRLTGDDWSGEVPIPDDVPAGDLVLEFVATDEQELSSKPEQRTVRHAPVPKAAPKVASNLEPKAVAEPAPKQAAVPAQAPTASLDDCIRAWLDARADRARCEAAGKAYLRAIPDLPASLRKLEPALLRFADPSATPTATADADGLLATILQRRQDGRPPHQLLPALLLLNRADPDDPRVWFALLEAHGTKSALFDAEKAKAAALACAERLRSTTDRAARTRFVAFLPILEGMGDQAIPWLQRRLQDLAASLGVDQPFDVQNLQQAVVDATEGDYQAAVRQRDTRAVEEALRRLTKVDPTDAAPWLLLAMAQASFGGSGNAAAALREWKRLRATKDPAPRLSHLGIAQLTGDSLDSVAQQIESGATGLGWFPDRERVAKESKAVDDRRTRLQKDLAKIDKEIQEWREKLDRIDRSAASQQYKNENRGLPLAKIKQLEERRAKLDGEPAKIDASAARLAPLLNVDREGFTLQ